MTIRRDVFVRANSIADVQELITNAENQKERLEAKEVILKNKIEEVNRYLMVIREEFLNFLTVNGIDVNYPVMGVVNADAVVPDTVPEVSMESIPIEQAMLPNIPNYMFLTTINLLISRYETLHREIESYKDKMLKARIHKAYLEAKLEGIIRATRDYRDRIKSKANEYNSAINNLEMVKSLYQSLYEFRYLFIITPDNVTSDTYIKFYNNSITKYSTYYYEKKKNIKRLLDNIEENYVQVVVDEVGGSKHKEKFKEISTYFSEYTGNNLPDKYVDAIPKKGDIIKELDKFSESLNSIISDIKKVLDSIRGVKGIGNSVVDSLYSSVVEISKSYATQRKVEHSELEDVRNSNYTVRLGVKQKIESIKNKMQLGVEALDDSFVKANRDFLRKISLTIGYPVNYDYDKNVTLEDAVREKVRQKYGGTIPFCDEEKIVNPDGSINFIKKKEIDDDKKIPKKDVLGDKLEKRTRIEEDILSI